MICRLISANLCKRILSLLGRYMVLTHYVPVRLFRRTIFGTPCSSPRSFDRANNSYVWLGRSWGPVHKKWARSNKAYLNGWRKSWRNRRKFETKVIPGPNSFSYDLKWIFQIKNVWKYVNFSIRQVISNLWNFNTIFF